MESTRLSQSLIGPSKKPGPELRTWQLWLDGHSVSVREDCIEALEEARKAILLQKGVDILGNAKALLGLVGAPTRGSLAARIFENIRKEANRISLLIWVWYVAEGKRPPVGWKSQPGWHPQIDNGIFGISEARRYETLGELFTRAGDVPAEWAQTAPPRRWMSFGALRRWLVEATEEDWQQAREDWRMIANAIWAWKRVEAVSQLCERKIEDGSLPATAPRHNIEFLGRAVRAVPLTMIMHLYREPFIRAAMVSFIMRARRSKLKRNVEQVMATLRNLIAAVEAVDREAEALLQSA